MAWVHKRNLINQKYIHMKKSYKKIKLVSIVLSMVIFSSNIRAQINNTLDFDGINDYVEIPYNPAFSSAPVSIQVSAKVSQYKSNFQSALTSRDMYDGGKTAGFAIYAGTNAEGPSKNRWRLYSGNSSPNWSNTTNGAPEFVPGEWATLTIVITNNNGNDSIAFYVNTDFVVRFKYEPNTARPMRVGAGATEGNPQFNFQGQIDELKIWSKALTAEEISNGINHKLTGTEPGLVAYYNFDQGIPSGDNTTVNLLNDITPNNNDGTLYNMALNGPTSNWVSSSLVLPVNLANFSAVKKDGFNLLQWSTASEQNSNRFEIQRSKTGTNFNTIGTIRAAANSNNIQEYQYSDNQLLPGATVYYYRLKMIDIDGNFKYSPVVFIKNNSKAVMTVYPNPVKEKTTINVVSKTLMNTEALLIDARGKALLRIFLNQSSTQIDLSKYSKGIYILKLYDGSTTRIIKE